MILAICCWLCSSSSGRPLAILTAFFSNSGFSYLQHLPATVKRPIGRKTPNFQSGWTRSTAGLVGSVLVALRRMFIAAGQPWRTAPFLICGILVPRWYGTLDGPLWAVRVSASYVNDGFYRVQDAALNCNCCDAGRQWPLAEIPRLSGIILVDRVLYYLVGTQASLVIDTITAGWQRSMRQLPQRGCFWVVIEG